MLKKAARYICIVFGLVALWASTSRTAMQYISEKRDGDKWWDSYPCLHGDLVSMAYLDFVKKFTSVKDISFTPAAYTGDKNTALYLHGDSYAWHLADSAFAGVCDFHFIDRNHGSKYHLDSTKRNVLIIEISERYIRDYFANTNLIDQVYDSVAKKPGTSFGYSLIPAKAQYASLFPDVHLSGFFNKYINQNLQGNLFNYNFIMPVFEWKAALNYYVFNRASGDVVISKDHNFLFLKETVTTTDIGSSYIPLTQNDIAPIVSNLNVIYDHFKAAGFSEVYLSMIPNAATIMQPEGYNDLIPLIQNDPRLRMKIIDAYTVFKNTKQVLYMPGDTHWNKQGKQQWLNLVNQKLTNDSITIFR